MSFKKFNMIPNMHINIKQQFALLLLTLITMSSCKKIFDLPDEKDYLSSNVNYNNKIFDPILGRNTVMGGFNGDNSTQPIKFEIINPRYGDGRPVTDLFQVKPTYVWTKAYTGLEKSIEEIEAKRKLEDHPLFEVRQSGEFIMWASTNNDLITPRSADSTNFPQDTRYFDVKITNTGGTTTIRDLQVRPFRERPYEPSDDFNIYSGGPAPHPKSPYNPNSRNYIRPFLDGVIGAQTEEPLRSNDDYKDVVVYIRPFTGGNGNSIRFKFLDKDSVAINPTKFNETKWDRIVHGFNMEKTNEYVQYTVAYPIPLVEVPTNYAPGGSRDHAEFSYSRIGFGGGRAIAKFGIDFAIYKKGDWEVVFHFTKENPKFEDE
ncbi:DUF5007 domain-containing protein [Mucilaginibacter sp. UR6-1]|uniref:DUF5007 domain-containing protein n=1 Tax=Mucilaginibacter sp. UR6-1 TaxID=1435643 RepID=UPI001E57868B|nr:DUF5007 domain-containing protein [Mucilaginibacter sp. UR6-1]MCC8408094.1 DUF5007 domain-containing protein [Mucilaginibacter sp. UR6-1]